VAGPAAGGTFGRVFKATLFGFGAGLIGALIWFAVRRLANLELGLVAIVVGFMVGKAVRKGSGNRGGLAYQILAVLITYCCIAANYMPDILMAVINASQEDRAAAVKPELDDPTAGATVADTEAIAVPDNGALADEANTPVGAGQMVVAVVVLFLLVFAFSLAAPFLAGAENIIGLLIIGFALWEAWKFNSKLRLPISGPYHIAPGAG